MDKKSGPSDDEKTLREKIIGLGHLSHKKSYYSELRKKLGELERFRALLDQISDAVFVLSHPSGEIVDFNETACKMTGLGREEIRALSFDEITDWFNSQVRRTFASGWDKGLEKNIRTSLKRKQGTPIPVEIRIRQVAFGEENFAVIVGRDISETLEAERKLKELNEELENRVAQRTAELTGANEKLRIDELRLEALLILNQMTWAPDADLAGFCLEKALLLTRSDSGYLAMFDEAEALDGFHTTPAGSPDSSPWHAGFWEEAAGRKEPLIINSSDDRPPNSGAPGGDDVPERHLHVPVFDGGRVVIVAGIAGKKTPYDAGDIRQLTLLIQGMWTILLRKRAQEENLRINNELALSLEHLKNTQAHLVESEKMASLGNLVAGVAHEINTPLGVSITEASFISEKAADLMERFDTGALRRSDLADYLSKSIKGAENLLANLKRAAGLVESFKQVAVDQSSEDRRVFDLKKYLASLLSSLSTRLTHTTHEISVNCDDSLIMDSFPGTFSRIVNHLVVNSLLHGFEEMENGRILLSLSRQGDNLLFRYSDNGAGMERQNVRLIFDPFYTTKRASGGTGLGMHIVYNLVTQKLGGRIRCTSSPGEGIHFSITVPLKSP